MRRADSRWEWLEMQALRHAPALFFVLVFAGFSLVADGFLSVQNVRNLVTQSAATGILAVGMTFVLLIGRVDLSVGAVMFLGGAICGKLLEADVPFWAALGAMFTAALAFGAVNFFVNTRFRVVSFIVTLATLYLGRGLGHWLTQTRPTPVAPFEAWGGWSLAGLGAPTWIFGLVVLTAHAALRHTGFGRQLYAVGADAEAARRGGVRVERIVAAAFMICSLCAGLAAAVSLTQSPTVSPDFGTEMEFTAIAAAVLGGTSLFGGRGSAFPGAVLGAVLLQMVTNGLNIKNVDPYLYPMILGAIIFLAVLTDSQRKRKLDLVNRRRIRTETP